MYRNIVFVGILLSSFGFATYASSAEKRLKVLLGALSDLKGKEAYNTVKITKLMGPTRQVFTIILTTKNAPIARDTGSERLICYIERPRAGCNVSTRYPYDSSQHFSEMDDIFEQLPGQEIKGPSHRYKAATIDWGNKTSEAKS